jgi:hypothetical protein
MIDLLAGLTARMKINLFFGFEGLQPVQTFVEESQYRFFNIKMQRDGNKPQTQNNEKNNKAIGWL